MVQDNIIESTKKSIRVLVVVLAMNQKLTWCKLASNANIKYFVHKIRLQIKTIANTANLTAYPTIGIWKPVKYNTYAAHKNQHVIYLVAGHPIMRTIDYPATILNIQGIWWTQNNKNSHKTTSTSTGSLWGYRN